MYENWVFTMASTGWKYILPAALELIVNQMSGSYLRQGSVTAYLTLLALNDGILK